MTTQDLVITRPEGLYCAAGDFHIDPWRPVQRAVITHAHGDHARVGHAQYLASAESLYVLRARLGDIALQTLPWGEAIEINGVRVSLHPASHVLGAAQVRLEHRGEVWVVSGDYRVENDRTCTAFEPVRCHVFVSESTFGLPIYRWQPQDAVIAGIDAWWRANAAEGRTSLLFAYAFGKAQRILAAIDASTGPLVMHGAVEPLNRAYRASGIELPPTLAVADVDKAALARALVVAPPSAQGSPWLRRFGDYSDAAASGWMQLRGARRRKALDRGFVLSDHADWPGLLSAIAATRASRVIVTHGQVGPLVRWLGEQGYDAGAFATEYGDEALEGDTEAADKALQGSSAEEPDAATEPPQ